MKVVYHPAYLDHRGGGYHPESPSRLDAITGRLAELGFDSFLEPEMATREDVLLAHSSDYIDYLSNVKGGLDLDTDVNDLSFNIAHLSAGGALEAA